MSLGDWSTHGCPECGSWGRCRCDDTAEKPDPDIAYEDARERKAEAELEEKLDRLLTEAQ